MEGGIAEIKAALESCRRTGTAVLTPQWRLMMAEAQQRAGRLKEALAELDQGLRHADEFQEHVNEPELHRVKGEIHLMRKDTAQGETSLRRAIELARAQKAKMLELRAANALADLKRAQGRFSEARDLLQPLNDWFQEGFNTRELRKARAILDSLGASVHRS